MSFIKSGVARGWFFVDEVGVGFTGKIGWKLTRLSWGCFFLEGSEKRPRSRFLPRLHVPCATTVFGQFVRGEGGGGGVTAGIGTWSLRQVWFKQPDVSSTTLCGHRRACASCVNSAAAGESAAPPLPPSATTSLFRLPFPPIHPLSVPLCRWCTVSCFRRPSRSLPGGGPVGRRGRGDRARHDGAALRRQGALRQSFSAGDASCGEAVQLTRTKARRVLVVQVPGKHSAVCALLDFSPYCNYSPGELLPWRSSRPLLFLAPFSCRRLANIRPSKHLRQIAPRLFESLPGWARTWRPRTTRAKCPRSSRRIAW